MYISSKQNQGGKNQGITVEEEEADEALAATARAKAESRTEAEEIAGQCSDQSNSQYSSSIQGGCVTTGNSRSL